MNNNQTIHLIESDYVTRCVLNMLLESQGYTVYGYSSARSFLDTIGRTAAGCILAEVQMPEMNGLELLATLKERGIFLPAIVMSGCSDADLEITARKRGAVDYFEKPFAPERLLVAIRNILTRSHSQVG